MQPKNNNFDYVIDPTFRNINRLFVLSFKNSKKDPRRDSFDDFYMLSNKINSFNSLINNKPILIKP